MLSRLFLINITFGFKTSQFQFHERRFNRRSNPTVWEAQFTQLLRKKVCDVCRNRDREGTKAFGRPSSSGNPEGRPREASKEGDGPRQDNPARWASEGRALGTRGTCQSTEQGAGSRLRAENGNKESSSRKVLIPRNFS